MVAVSQAEAAAQLPPAVAADVDALVVKLKRRQVVGAYATAVQTLQLLLQAITQTRVAAVETLLDVVRGIGRTLVEAAPLELSIGNSVRRVLKVVREEASSEEGGPAPSADINRAGMLPLSSQTSMYNVLALSPQTAALPKAHSDLKAAVVEAVNQMLDELETLYSSVSAQALEYIHTNEVILTLGTSRTVNEFFKAAARKRKFQVIVAETAPWYDGHTAAVELSRAGIDTTVVTDAAVFAMMARVNKVIIGTHAVLANGGLIARSGTHLVASAAKHHATPVVVLTGLFKLAPLYAFNQDTFNLLSTPAAALPFDDAEFTEKVSVSVPFFDYIPPELVSLFVTNIAGHPPSYIYRLLSEQYNAEDNVI
eukprot:Unigene14735_Nuclearia_a/m.44308 Unigene14735_Nuclearia_a/g.44308  ORF Unigene14735_Nuclearia_a/g.44308 Unigene14735_Nuclearia_a/m.44308 type:complete len:368 (+) Unigene14735_Nuclearia_a:3-1106(+)